jgi:ATP-dependent protease ClpP protease subunit
MRQFIARKGGAAPEDKRAFRFGDEADFRVSFTPVHAGKYTIYLYGLIESPNQFIDAIDVLDSATPLDLVDIQLQTPGGNLDAADAFIHAMRRCSAKVKVTATGGVHSAGTLILLNADEFELSEGFNALVHNGSCGPAGKFSDWEAEAAHTKRYMRKVFESNYKHFLTDDELEAMIGGKDIWLDAEGFVERWERRMTALEADEAFEEVTAEE